MNTRSVSEGGLKNRWVLNSSDHAHRCPKAPHGSQRGEVELAIHLSRFPPEQLHFHVVGITGVHIRFYGKEVVSFLKET